MFTQVGFFGWIPRLSEKLSAIHVRFQWRWEKNENSWIQKVIFSNAPIFNCYPFKKKSEKNVATDKDVAQPICLSGCPKEDVFIARKAFFRTV